MTVETVYQPHSYKPGNAGAAESIPFEYLAASDIVVTHIADASGATAELVPGTHFTLAGDGTAGLGTITAIGSWPTDDLFVIERETDRRQRSNYPAHQPLPAQSVAGDFDRITMMVQEAVARSVRSLQVLPGQTLAPINKADFAGQFFAGGPGGEIVPASGTGADGALRSDMASAANGKGAGLLIWNPSAAYAQLSAGWNLQRQPVPFEYFGAVGDFGDGDTLNDAAFAEAVEYSENIGGATILCFGRYGMGGTGAVTAHGTVFKGGNSREHGFHRLGSNPLESVIFFGTMPGAARILTGGGLRNLRVDAHGLSNQALHIRSMTHGHWEDIYLLDGINHSWLWNCLDTLIGGVDPTDNQEHIVLAARVENTVATGGNGITLSGSAVGAANPGNTSLTSFNGVRANIRNGHAMDFVNADGIDLYGLNVFRPSGGGFTGKAVKFRGDPYHASSAWHYARDNTLYGVEWSTAGVEAEGTNTPGVLTAAGALGGNTIYGKLGNGGQVTSPVVGTDAVLYIHYPEATRRIGAIRGVSVDRGTSETTGLAAARTQVLLEKIYAHWFFGSSNNHLGLGDASGNEWVLRINAATGDLECIRVGGSGKASFAELKLAGLQIKAGANDSGGAGRRMLYLDNL